MAEETKKPDPEKAKAEAKEKEIRFFTELVLLLIGLLFLGRLFAAWSSGRGAAGGEGQSFSIADGLDQLGIKSFVYSFLSAYVTFVNILSLTFAIIIVYCLVRIVQIQRAWQAKLNPEPVEKGEAAIKNSRWQAVLEHISSSNPSQWRLAILECDIILDELLDRNSYVGDTIGDKLKQADKSEFRTLDNAWEAHRIRNAIAHEGQDFVLTEREARRIVSLYESVFREFDFI